MTVALAVWAEGGVVDATLAAGQAALTVHGVTLCTGFSLDAAAPVSREENAFTLGSPVSLKAHWSPEQPLSADAALDGAIFIIYLCLWGGIVSFQSHSTSSRRDGFSSSRARSVRKIPDGDFRYPRRSPGSP